MIILRFAGVFAIIFKMILNLSFSSRAYLIDDLLSWGEAPQKSPRYTYVFTTKPCQVALLQEAFPLFSSLFQDGDGHYNCSFSHSKQTILFSMIESKIIQEGSG